MAKDDVPISVVYARADRQQIVKLTVAEGTTVAQAVELSGLIPVVSGGAGDKLNCAIFGRLVAVTQAVSRGDRIEILRPLLIDPKENRRQAAAKNKTEPKIKSR